MMACLLSVKRATMISNLTSGLTNNGVQRGSNAVNHHTSVDWADLGSCDNFKSFYGVVKHSFFVGLD